MSKTDYSRQPRGDNHLGAVLVPDIQEKSAVAVEDRRIDKRSMEYVVRSGLAGGVAGSAAKTLIAPLDRVKILFQTSNPHYKKYRGSFRGMFRAVNHIYSNDGVRGLYQGHSATLLRIFPYAAIKFVCYEQIRTVLIPDNNHETAARRLLAGSLAGVASVFCTYPLDLIRVRLAFQTHHSAPGSPAHTKGQFGHLLRQIYNEQPRFTFNTGGELQNELWITRTVYRALGKNLGVFQSLTNFYRGFAPTILGMVPYAGVSFYTHDLIHDIFRSPVWSQYTVKGSPEVLASCLTSTHSHDKRPPLKTWAQLLAGGSAGMLAQAAAYPFEVIRRRMQVGGVVNAGGQFYSITKITRIIYAESGLKGFYVGLGIGFIKVVPMFACSFYVYERCKTMLNI
ncbi:unnamed protein product [Kuraishia capsulata CBS 1993]|uniref:Mitochondrial carrier protein LEU5 n=1 Tax=Kuraishia capsulata CBS 1993 TaxID=1382522 RepID=W6MUD4_9ASCO|nr:uncharacterized protein KUCA_T00005144001 [Kuraishia capsulata CBS 1993]CDK29157.1 unnamed protein product [Kuraishia capsulata CBS 1993]